MSHYKIKAYRHILLITLAMAGVWGCRKDEESVTPYPDTIEDIYLLLKQIPGSSVKSVFNFKGAIQDTVLNTNSGVRVFLTDTEALFEDETGRPVPCSTCQSLDLDIQEANKKSDFASNRVSNITNDGSWFESFGAVNVTATCDGKKLKLQANRNIKIQIPAALPLKNDLSLLLGQQSSTTFKGWRKTNEKVFQADWKANAAKVEGYELLSTTLGWVAAGEVAKPSATSFCVQLPNEYTPQNTLVYLSFKTIKSVLTLPANQSGNFCFSANIPIGYPVKVLTVSKIDGQYKVFSLELPETGSTNFVEAKPIIKSEQDVIEALKGL